MATTIKNIIQYFHSLPIKTKLALKFGFFVAIILILVGNTTFFVFRQKLFSDTQDLILLQYENITNTLSDISSENVGDNFQNKVPKSIEEATNMGFLTFIYDRTGLSVESSSYVGDYVPKDMNGFFSRTINKKDYLFYAKNYRGFYVVIGKNLSAAYADVDSLVNALKFVEILSIILAFGIGYIFSQQALTSLSRLVEDVSSIQPEMGGDIRFSGKYAKDEIGVLAEAFDDLLSRIRASMQREKEFTQDVSHELRTPLMALSTSLDLLEGKIKDESSLTKIENMHKTIKNMNGLIDELLFLARKTSQTHTEKMEIGTFLTTYIQDHFSIPAKGKNIELTCTIKKDFTLKTHTLYLQKIFGNLVKNAIAYTDEGGKIEVIIENKKVTIKDTGRGMTPDELGHIWDRFYRADASRAKGSAAGYGLGLAIVKKVIDEHNWKVSVDSEKGKGTEFKVSF